MAKSSKSKKPVVSAMSPNKKPSPKGRKGGDKVFMQNDELYRLFVDSIKDYAILMLDPTGHVLTWNPGAELLKGYHADEIIGKHFSIFYPREDVEHGKPEMELRVATNENRFEDEGWRVRKDGSRFWASVIITALRDETQRLVGFGKITRDLTGRWQAEETLRSQVQLLDLASDSVMIRDLDDRIVYWNKGSERLYGWKKEHVLGQVVYTFLQTEFPRPKARDPGDVPARGSLGGRADPYLCGWPARSRCPAAGRWSGMRRVRRSRISKSIPTSPGASSWRSRGPGISRTSARRCLAWRPPARRFSQSPSSRPPVPRSRQVAVAQTVTTVDQVAQTAAQAAQRARGVGEAVSRTQEIGQKGRQAVDDSIAALEKLEEQVESTAESILMLAEQAQAIGEIIATVNDIAEQTNLLALNAAIEASRAGEYGRGFTVLAGEVKALASQSKKATTQVRQILGEIQKATNTAVLSTEEVTKGVSVTTAVASQAGGTIKILTETLTETAQAATQIMASAGQQATGMSQIHQAMKNLDQVARQNLVAIRQVEQAAQNLSALGNQLTSLTRS